MDCFLSPYDGNSPRPGKALAGRAQHRETRRAPGQDMTTQLLAVQQLGHCFFWVKGFNSLWSESLGFPSRCLQLGEEGVSPELSIPVCTLPLLPAPGLCSWCRMSQALWTWRACRFSRDHVCCLLCLFISLLYSFRMELSSAEVALLIPVELFQVLSSLV